MDYDDNLEKAHCFAPDYTKQSLSFVLQTIQGEAERAAREGKLPEFSPQFGLSAPRSLLYPADESVRAVLRHKYLLKPKSAEHKKKAKGVERRIDRFLVDDLQVSESLIRRKPTIDDLLGVELSRGLPRDLVPKPIARALISQSTICLVDGVDLHSQSIDVLVHRVNRVAHAFWQYNEIKQMFLAAEQKTMLRAAIVFDGHGDQVEPSLKWRSDYAFHQFEKDADITVKAGSHRQELVMRDTLQRLLAES